MYIFTYIYTSVYIYTDISTEWVKCSPMAWETGVQSQVE